MKVLIRYISKLIGPVADILSILSFLGIGLASIVDKFKTLNTTSIVLFFIGTLLLIRVIVKQIKSLIKIVEETQVTDDIKKITLENNIQHIKQALPKTKTLEVFLKKIDIRAKNWADDAVLLSCNLYLAFSNKRWEEPSLQTMYYSPWKKEEAYFYEGKSTSESYSEESTILKRTSESELTPFFIINQNWQSVVIKAFNAVSSKLSNKCRIAIHDSVKMIKIEYAEGRLDKVRTFEIRDDFKSIK